MRRRTRMPVAAAIGAVILLCVLAVVAIWASDGRWGRGVPESASPPTIGATAGAAVDAVPMRPADAFAMVMEYAYDGDTIRARVVETNSVVRTTAPIRIRLIGIDTPEGTPSVECWADEARDHLTELLPEGATLWAAPDQDSWDRFNRRLFYLWTDDGRFVNYELVAAGDAVALTIEPNTTHADLFAAAEAAAAAPGPANGVRAGRRSRSACTTPPQSAEHARRAPSRWFEAELCTRRAGIRATGDWR